MKLARWRAHGAVAEGFVDGAEVIAFPGDLRVADVLAQGLDAAQAMYAWREQGLARPLAEVELLAPLVPAAVRDFVAFEEHVEGVSASVDGKNEVVPEWYEAPTFYFTNPHTVRGPGEVVSVPEASRLDFELEVAVVLGCASLDGAGGENLDAERAAEAILGYTIMNDWSTRDLQSRR